MKASHSSPLQRPKPPFTSTEPTTAEPRDPRPIGVSALIRLQRSAGNAAVSSVIAETSAAAPTPVVQRDPGDLPAAESHDEQGYLAPPPVETQRGSNTVMEDVLSAAMHGYPGVDFAIRNFETSVETTSTFVGAPGQASGQVDRAIVDDLKVMLKWTFERPGEYSLHLRRNARGELSVSSWVPERYLRRRPAPGVPLTAEGENVVVLVGSPKPGQAFPLQFATAAKQISGHAIWIVERTGYELAKVDLGDLIKMAPGGQLTWVSSASEVTAAVNALPKGSVRLMKVFSHGVRGEVDLRYGWSGKANYGIDKTTGAAIDGRVFSPRGVIDLESCNGGTNTDGDSLAQTIADASGHETFGWTGRTSYADVNAGTGGVRGSEITFSTDALAELWSRWKAESAPSQQVFEPHRQPAQGP